MQDKEDENKVTPVGEDMLKIERYGKPPILIPYTEHYVEGLIKDLQEQLNELKKKKPTEQAC